MDKKLEEKIEEIYGETVGLLDTVSELINQILEIKNKLEMVAIDE